MFPAIEGSVEKIDQVAGRWIYQEHGIEAVQKWNRLPRVDMKTTLDKSMGLAHSAKGAFDFLRWPEFVLRLTALYESAEDIPFLFFVSRTGESRIWKERWSAEARDSIDAMMDPVFVEMFGVAGARALTVTDNTTGKGSIIHEDGGRKENVEIMIRMISTTVSLAAWHCRYLAQCPEQLIEITPAPDAKRRRRAAKTAKKKPWLREDRPHIILLDPTKARQYGHRIDRGGTHASPIPHQRLGNWATLKHEKYGKRRGEKIWRPPTWVGDKEWVFRGSRYRVLDVGIKSKGAP